LLLGDNFPFHFLLLKTIKTNDIATNVAIRTAVVVNGNSGTGTEPTATVIVAVLPSPLSGPLPTKCRVTVYVPAGVLLSAVRVRVEVPE
jgi:hypothetical protein